METLIIHKFIRGSKSFVRHRVAKGEEAVAETRASSITSPPLCGKIVADPSAPATSSRIMRRDAAGKGAQLNTETTRPSRLQRCINFFPLLFIRFYRKCISPLFPPTCRFEPSCSRYGLEAFQTHAFFKAIWLTVWRILRCNPFNPGGFDPVPPAGGKRTASAQERGSKQLDSGGNRHAEGGQGQDELGMGTDARQRHDDRRDSTAERAK